MRTCGRAWRCENANLLGSLFPQRGKFRNQDSPWEAGSRQHLSSVVVMGRTAEPIPQAHVTSCNDNRPTKSTRSNNSLVRHLLSAKNRPACLDVARKPWAYVQDMSDFKATFGAVGFPTDTRSSPDQSKSITCGRNRKWTQRVFRLRPR